MFPFSFIGSGVDAQALASYNSLIAAGYTVPQGLAGINSAFRTIKTIYGTSDITTAVSYFADPSLAYQSGAGSGTTLGQAIRTLPNLVDNTRATDAVQTTAASQPLLLTHEGANYWWGSGVAGNFVSTPNAAANNIVNDFDIKITATYIFNSTINSYIGKWDSGQQSWRLYLGSDNRLVWNIQGQSLFPSSVAINSTMNHLRVTRQSSNGEIKYFFSTEPLSTSLESITWVQLGITQMGVTGSAPTTTSSLRIGQEQGNPFNGKIYRVTVANTIGGAPVVDFNPNQYNASVSQTQWTSSTGEIWSINTGTAATGYKGVLVDRTTVMSDGVDDRLSASLSGNAIRTQYFAHRAFSSSSGWWGLMQAGGAFAQAFSYNSSKYNFYQQGALDGPFGDNVLGVNSRLRVSGSIGGTGTNWIPFQNGVDVSNSAANIGGLVQYEVLSLFSRSTATLFDNGILNSYIVAQNADTLTQRTSVQNYLRQINRLT